MVGFYKSHKLKDGGTNKYKRYRCSKKYPDRSHPVGACISESVIEEYMLERVYPELQDKIYRLNKAAAQKRQLKMKRLRYAQSLTALTCSSKRAGSLRITMKNSTVF